MRNRYHLLFIIAGMLFLSNVADAQHLGTYGTSNSRIYLPGKFLEIGINNVAAFGAATPPTGYHPYPAGPLAEVYDFGHDGWTVGSPHYYGDYTYPGSPFEGWELQIGTTASSGVAQAFTSGTASVITPTGSLCALEGNLTSYINSGGKLGAVWEGQAWKVSGTRYLNITQITTIDTLGNTVNVTTTFKNTNTTTPTPVMYYMRSCDPDNDEAHGGGTYFSTDNTIVHQNEDALHDVEVDAEGTLYHDHWSLCTRDCRAKAVIYQEWPLSSSTSLSTVWSETYGTNGSTVEYTYNHHLNGDIAIALVYKLDPLPAGDSTAISYAYVFNDEYSNIDSAFPVPQLVVNSGAPVDSTDTVNTCLDPTLFSIPVNIAHGNTGVWTYSNWNWSPSTGLASDTGVSNTVNVLALSGNVTYTIVGTDTTLGGCESKTFYLTVIPCFNLGNSGPVCQGSPLSVNVFPVNPDATYELFNSADSLVSTGPSYNIPVTALSDSGTYMGVLFISGSPVDTAYTTVVINQVPYVTLPGIAPLCSGTTLALTSTVTATPDAETWTGPNGFTATTADASISPVTTAATGIYTVIATLNGCADTATEAVLVDSMPITPSILSETICQYDTLMLFSADSTAGVNYIWTGPYAFTATVQNPVINNAQPYNSGEYYVTATLGICSATDSTYGAVTVVPSVVSVNSNSPVCSGGVLSLFCTFAPDTVFGTYNWYGPMGYTSGNQDPNIIFVPTTASGTYSVTESYNGCTSNPATVTVVIDSTPQIPNISNNTPVCQYDTLALYSSDGTQLPGLSYAWFGPHGFTSTSDTSYIYNVDSMTLATYTVYAILGMCLDSASMTLTVTPAPYFVPTSNSPICTGDTLKLHANGQTGTTYNWSGPYAFYAYSTAPNPILLNAGLENSGTYSVTGTLNGCSATETVEMVVNATPPPPFVNWLTYCQYETVAPLMATGENILWYPADTIYEGSATAPVPPTASVGSTFYFATQTVNGCTSALDSIQITVNPTPTVTVTPADTGVCPHSAFLLTATDTDAITYYHWFPGMYLGDTTLDTVTVNPETNIVYTVVASNQYGCTDSATSNITVYPAALIAMSDSVTLYPGESYTISPATNCTSFSWFPASGLSATTIADPVAAPAVSTKYTVDGQTDNGCTTYDSINIKISAASLLALPNAFTPGVGDGANSEFRIIKKGEATLNYFRIFDRWGQKVFESTDINAGWDGTFNGTAQPFGVYVYEVEAVTSAGQNFVMQGNVTLIR